VNNRTPAAISRRIFLGGVAASALAALPAAAQEQPPVIEPIDPDQTAPEPTPTPAAPAAEPIAPEGGAPGEIEQIAEDEAGEYVAETGHNVSDPFLAIWKQAGAAAGIGMPLSEERFNPDTGAVEQWFEGIVLINAPDDAGTWTTGGRPLGDAVVASEVPASARQQAAEPAVELAAFWSAGGGQAIFGSPRSQPYQKGGATRQAFDCAVLEVDGGSVSAVAIVPDIIEAEGLDGDAAFLPAPPTLGTSTLVTASDGLRLRSRPSMDAEIVAVLDDNVEFIAVTGATGDWIPGYADGYSGYVAAEYLTAPEELPSAAVGGSWDSSVWQGAALGETNLRSGPGTDSRIVKTIEYGDSIVVTEWVKGQRVDGGSDTWAKLRDGTYAYERNVGRTGPVEPTPVPDDAPWEGKWIDCNLTQQLLIAYEGRTPVHIAVQTTGKPGWETPTGYFAINTRVANETMESGSIGADEFYKLENVLYTQYFTDRGHALHFAWWKTPETIGRPGSHGCLNLLLDDARWFWDWADIGVPVYCHY
jgi:uncharacterized protein YgiM (DUF1202 family)